MAAHPDRRGLGIERDADAFALEILRLRDALLSVDEDEAVAEGARREDRNRHERVAAAILLADELRGRKLGEVESELAHHAIEDLARLFDRQIVEIDPFGRDLPHAQRLHAVVLAAGEAEREARGGHDGGRPARSFAVAASSTAKLSGSSTTP